MSTFNICDYGAVGDAETNDAAAIQAAVDACSEAGGGRVLVPAGRTCLTGYFEIKSNVEFHVERGARIIASTDRGHYPRGPGRRRALIGAQDAENISFTGGGEIDGRAPLFMAEKGPHIYKRDWGTFMFFLVGCRNVTFRDLTIRDGTLWTVRISGCRDVVISGVRILNNMKVPNNDAIDVDACRNVRISDCHIVAGDDGIVLKAVDSFARECGACENVLVTNCTIRSSSSALCIGCEARAPIRNVIFQGCVVHDTHRGLSINLSHEGDVENVLFSDILVETRLYHPRWWGRGEPIYVKAMPWTKDDSVGRIRNVRFSNILCRSENGALIWGWEPDRIQGLLLENVRVEIDKWTEFRAGQHDIRPYPEDEGRGSQVGAGVYDHPTAGFFLKNATDVTLRNCEVTWNAGRRQQEWRHALEAHGVADLRLEGFRGEAAWPHRDAPILQE